MADIHLIQWTVAFGAALYLTYNWLATRPPSRWRHIVVGLFNTLLWIPIAYTADNVHVATDSGEAVRFGSSALGGVATFMVVVCIGSLLVGLVLWTEEAADEASSALPSDMRRGQAPRRGD